jgi:hypothetical protein
MADAVPAETLSDKLTNVPQLEELEVVERGVVSLMETASQALISLSSIDTLNQAELETQCTDYLTLLEVRERPYSITRRSYAPMYLPLTLAAHLSHNSIANSQLDEVCRSLGSVFPARAHG